MDEKVLDILHIIGYNGVPSREDNVSVKNIIEYVMQNRKITFYFKTT